MTMIIGVRESGERGASSESLFVVEVDPNDRDDATEFVIRINFVNVVDSFQIAPQISSFLLFTLWRA